MNCDEVLQAIIQRGEAELAKKQQVKKDKKESRKVLKVQADLIRAKSTDPTEWSATDLRTMLRYKMRCKGHTAYKKYEDVLAQYECVKDDESEASDSNDEGGAEDE